MAGPACAGAKLAAVGVIGTSAAIITPAIASAGTAGPPPSVVTLTGAESPPAIVAQAPPGGLATFPNAKIVTPPLFAASASQSNAAASQSAATPPSAAAENAPAPAGGPPYPTLGSAPNGNGFAVPIGDAWQFRVSGFDPATHVGGTVAVYNDPTGQYLGYMNIAVGFGVGGVFNGGYGARASFGYGPQIRVVTGDITMSAQWNQYNGTLSVTPTYDVANGVAVGGTWLFPMSPGGPPPQFVATRTGAWYTFGAEASLTYGITFPIPKNIGGQILDSLNRSNAIQMYLDSGQPIPDDLLNPSPAQQPPANGAVLMPDSPTLAQLLTFPAPSQGFPPVPDSSAASGLGSASPDQLSPAGPSMQNLMLNLTPTPGLSFIPPYGSLPPGSYFDNLGQLRQLAAAASEPPTPAVPVDLAGSPSAPAQQGPSASTDSASAPSSATAGSNLPLPLESILTPYGEGMDLSRGTYYTVPPYTNVIEGGYRGVTVLQPGQIYTTQNGVTLAAPDGQLNVAAAPDPKPEPPDLAPPVWLGGIPATTADGRSITLLPGISLSGGTTVSSSDGVTSLVLPRDPAGNIQIKQGSDTADSISATSNSNVHLPADSTVSTPDGATVTLPPGTYNFNHFQVIIDPLAQNQAPPAAPSQDPATAPANDGTGQPPSASPGGGAPAGPPPAPDVPASPVYTPVIDTGTSVISSTSMGTSADPLSGIGTGVPASLNTGVATYPSTPAATPVYTPTITTDSTPFTSLDMGTSADPLSSGSTGSAGASGGVTAVAFVGGTS